jgi:excisionase family DNA binding protein
VIPERTAFGEPLLDAQELADALGMTRRWVYGQVEENGLPAYKLGRSLAFELSAVRGWLAKRRVGNWPDERAGEGEDAPATSHERPLGATRVHGNYERELERAKAEFGDVPLAGVTRSHVRALVASRAAEGVAANTIRNMLIPLKALFTHALDEGLVPANPASRVAVPPMRKRKIVPPSREQVEKLMHMARPEARDVLLVAASLGLRRGELLALRWGDVDFEARLVRVHATNDAGTVAETTKTEAGERSVPLFESARKALAAQARESLQPRRRLRLLNSRGNAAQPTQLRAAGVQARPPRSRARGRLPLPRLAPLCRLDAHRSAGRRQTPAGDRRPCLGDRDARHLRPPDARAGDGGGFALRPARRAFRTRSGRFRVDRGCAGRRLVDGAPIRATCQTGKRTAIRYRERARGVAQPG